MSNASIVPETQSTTASTANLSNATFREAFEAIQPELATVSERDLLPINIDVQTAGLQVLGCVPKIAPFRAMIVKELPEFDIARFDKLELYAGAVTHAQTLFQAASQPPEQLQQLFEKLTALRDLYKADIEVLAKHKVLDSKRLSELRNTQGFKAVSLDVLLLCSILRDHWSAIEGKTTIQRADLDEAEETANELAIGFALKEQGPAAASAASAQRQRAYTLFVNAYDDARRALSYLRWRQEDVESIAPSLYTGRGGRGTPSSEVKPTPVTPPAPTSPATPSAPATATPTEAQSAAPNAPPGMPGNRPLIG